MRNIADKLDNVSELNAAEFNKSIMEELENAVTKSGVTLDPAGGPDTDSEMLARAITKNSVAASVYTDGGVANSYVLTAAFSFKQPAAYFNGFTIYFKAANNNTGASVVNVSVLGAKDLTLPDGTALPADSIIADNYYIATYVLANDRFELVKGNASAPDASTTTKGIVELATAAEVKSETAGVLAITPDTLRSSYGVPDGQVLFDGTGSLTILSSKGIITSVTKGGTGVYTINFTALAGLNYIVHVGVRQSGAGVTVYHEVAGRTTTSLPINLLNVNIGLADSSYVGFSLWDLN